MDKTDKVVTFIEECRQMQLKLLPPDVNSGEFKFTEGPAADGEGNRTAGKHLFIESTNTFIQSARTVAAK